MSGSSNFATWSESDVGQWLDDNQWSQLKVSFRAKRINGAMLSQLDDAQLQVLGVSDIFHRKRILLDIAALSKQASSAVVATASAASVPVPSHSSTAPPRAAGAAGPHSAGSSSSLQSAANSAKPGIWAFARPQERFSDKDKPLHEPSARSRIPPAAKPPAASSVSLAQPSGPDGVDRSADAKAVAIQDKLLGIANAKGTCFLFCFPKFCEFLIPTRLQRCKNHSEPSSSRRTGKRAQRSENTLNGDQTEAKRASRTAKNRQMERRRESRMTLFLSTPAPNTRLPIRIPLQSSSRS